MTAIDHLPAEPVTRAPGLLRRLPTSGVALCGLALILFWIAVALLAPVLPLDPPNKLVPPS